MKPWQKILLWSVSVWALGAVPLLIYIVFGPADGNPIGLGLLYMAGQAVGLIGIVLSLFSFFKTK
jgi:hypothetical protein